MFLLYYFLHLLLENIGILVILFPVDWTVEAIFQLYFGKDGTMPWKLVFAKHNHKRLTSETAIYNDLLRLWIIDMAEVSHWNFLYVMDSISQKHFNCSVMMLLTMIKQASEILKCAF